MSRLILRLIALLSCPIACSLSGCIVIERNSYAPTPAATYPSPPASTHSRSFQQPPAVAPSSFATPQQGQYAPAQAPPSGNDRQSVVEYIAFVRQIEATRAARVSTDERSIQSLAASSQAPPIDAGANSQKIQSFTATMAANWSQLANSFNARIPPPACAEFAAHYSDLLRTTANTVEETARLFADAMAGFDRGDTSAATTATNRLQNMDSTVQRVVDEQARQADRSLEAVCSAYGIVPGFTIR